VWRLIRPCWSDTSARLRSELIVSSRCAAWSPLRVVLFTGVHCGFCFGKDAEAMPAAGAAGVVVCRVVGFDVAGCPGVVDKSVIADSSFTDSVVGI